MKTIEFQLSQNINLEMVEISEGSFLMGSSADEAVFRKNETPQHTVEISSFYIAKCPVTQAQWFAVMNKMPKIAEDFRGEDLSVVNVWLEKALEFCAKISKLTRKNFRLPSEAEWEYVCRAGTSTPYFFGETLAKDSANFDSESLTAVGSLYRALTDVCGVLTDACRLLTDAYRVLIDVCRVSTDVCKIFTDVYRVFYRSCYTALSVRAEDNKFQEDKTMSKQKRAQNNFEEQYSF